MNSRLGWINDNVTMKLRKRSPKDFKLHLGISKSFKMITGGCLMSDACRAKLKGKMGMNCQSDGTQKLPSCTRTIISQADSIYIYNDDIIMQFLEQWCHVVSLTFLQNKQCCTRRLRQNKIKNIHSLHKRDEGYTTITEAKVTFG